jgi:outer membrane protein OmpA-like peptidoglycan-associated protein
MRYTQRLAVPLFAVASSLAIAACQSAPAAAPSPAATPAKTPPAAPTAGRTRTAPATARPTPRVTLPGDTFALIVAAQSHKDSIAAAAAAVQAAAFAQSSMRSKLSEDVLFGVDSAELSLDGRMPLDRKIAILVANPGVGLRLTGHAYERASDADNVALGVSRAQAAKRYLVIQGIDSSRVVTAGHAEAKPAPTISDSLLNLMRRVDAEPTSLPAVLKKP